MCSTSKQYIFLEWERGILQLFTLFSPIDYFIFTCNKLTEIADKEKQEICWYLRTVPTFVIAQILHIIWLYGLSAMCALGLPMM